MSKELSPVKQKILLVLLTCVSLALSPSPKTHYKLLRGFPKMWKKINEKLLGEEIKKLYRSKLVSLQENSDGSLTMTLTNKGKLKTLNYYFAEMKIKPHHWDKKWRIIIFDIPEKIRKGRDALREKLCKLGFYELQKSVFVFPYDCKDDVDFLIELFNLRKYVRYGTLDSIDNSLHLKKIFHLS